MKSASSATQLEAVAPTRALARRGYSRQPQGDARGADAQPSDGRPVPVGDHPGDRPSAAALGAKPQAALVAHLIATHMGLPQTRQLRRAEPAAADLTYRHMNERAGQPLRPVRDKRP